MSEKRQATRGRDPLFDAILFRAIADTRGLLVVAEGEDAVEAERLVRKAIEVLQRALPEPARRGRPRRPRSGPGLAGVEVGGW